MARDPGSIWKPLPEAGAPDGYRKTQFIVHSTGTRASALNNWKYFSNTNVHVESTFIIGETPADPTLQIMDSTDRADANGDANNNGISVEVVGNGIDPFTPWQIQELIRIGRWARANHPIEPRIIPSAKASGFGWHVMFGAPGPWTSVRGKVCPGNARIKQLREVIFPAIFGSAPAPAPGKHPVKGAIAGAYNRLILPPASWAFFLGAPKGPEVLTWGKDAYWQEFEKGVIYAHGGFGYVVWGDILKKWREIGSEGAIGYPITDETSTPDTHGRFNHFAGGPKSGGIQASIYWHPWTGAHVVQGAIRQKWAELGWERGLGYPVTDEMTCPDKVGRYNHFSGRPNVKNDGQTSIYFHPSTGAHPVVGAFRAEWAKNRWEAGPWGYPTSGEYRGADGLLAQNFQRGRVVFNNGRVEWVPNRV